MMSLYVYNLVQKNVHSLCSKSIFWLNLMILLNESENWWLTGYKETGISLNKIRWIFSKSVDFGIITWTEFGQHGPPGEHKSAHLHRTFFEHVLLGLANFHWVWVLFFFFWGVSLFDFFLDFFFDISSVWDSNTALREISVWANAWKRRFCGFLADFLVWF